METQTFKFIRGFRLLQAINVLAEEETYDDLESNIISGFPFTTKRQYATQPIRVVQMKLVPYVKTGDLLADSRVNSGGKVYEPKILFLREVVYQEEDLPTNITFTGADGETYNILPISLTDANCKVRCDCLDFYYRFSPWNSGSKALFGNPMPPYKRKTTTRPPVNPDKVPGICKHIIKSVEALTHSGLIAG